MGKTDNPLVNEDVVLQPPSHPWWHWALLIVPTVVITIISFVILVHVGLFAGMLLKAVKQKEESAARIKIVTSEMAQIEPSKRFTLPVPDLPTPGTPPLPTGIPPLPPLHTGIPPLGTPPVTPMSIDDARKEIHWHVVESGDSYWSIAKKHGVTSTAIEKANPDVIPTRMRIGQKLIIPQVDPRPPKKVIPEKLLIAPIPSTDRIPDALPTEPHQESSLSPNSDLEPLPATQPHPASTVKRATDSPIKISRETKTYGSSPPQIPKANLPEKVRPVVPNIAGIARYSYKQPARPAPTKSGPARKAFEQAAHAHGLNQLDKAIAGYRQVLQLDPGVQQAHHNLALALQAKGQLKEALAEFEVALAINPLSRESRQGFAAALNSSNFYIDAAREYQVLLQTFPNHGPAHLDLAGVYANHLKMSAEAKAHYRRALELAPNHQQAPAIRAWLAQQP